MKQIYHGWLDIVFEAGHSGVTNVVKCLRLPTADLPLCVL